MRSWVINVYIKSDDREIFVLYKELYPSICCWEISLILITVIDKHANEGREVAGKIKATLCNFS